MTMISPETVDFPGSSNLAEATYDPDTDNLHVVFRSGGSGTYFNVPRSTFLGLQTAGSAGAFLARQIKGRYAYEPD